MSDYLDKNDRFFQNFRYSKLEEKNHQEKYEDIDALNDETFGEGSNIDGEDWEANHEKLAYLFLEGDSSKEEHLDDSTLEYDPILRSISDLVLDNDDDPAIMTRGRRATSNLSGGSRYDCHSPILPSKNSPLDDIWSPSSIPRTDNGITNILQTLQTNSTKWLPPKARTLEELEQTLLGGYSQGGAEKLARSLPAEVFGSTASAAVPAAAKVAASPPHPSPSCWITAPGAHTLDQVERDLLKDRATPPNTMAPIGTPPQKKMMASPPFRNNPQMMYHHTHQGMPPSLCSPLNLPPHPILNPPNRLPYPGQPLLGPRLVNPKGSSQGFYPITPTLEGGEQPGMMRVIYHPMLNIHRPALGYPQGSRDPRACDPDDYAGLMTQKEKDWLIKIQRLQLHTDNPYLDDYYYTAHTIKRLSRQNNNLQVVLPETNKSETKAYVPAQFEGSLGKLQAVSVNYPRKVLDLSVCASGEESSPTAYHILRRVLHAIEKMYTLLLEMDDEDKRMLALPPDAHGPHMEQKASLVARLHTGLTQGGAEFFQQAMSVRKGRTLLARSLPYFNLSQQVSLMELLFGCLGNVLKKDIKDGVLVSYQEVFSQILSSCSLADIAGLLEALQTSPSRILALNHPFGRWVLEKILANLHGQQGETEEKRAHLIGLVSEILSTEPPVISTTPTPIAAT